MEPYKKKSHTEFLEFKVYEYLEDIKALKDKLESYLQLSRLPEPLVGVRWCILAEQLGALVWPHTLEPEQRVATLKGQGACTERSRMKKPEANDESSDRKLRNLRGNRNQQEPGIATFPRGL
ncbi:UNVERIFIED_CONTAM: hypothetical protein K2H54_051793 [Gekko kuhli]